MSPLDPTTFGTRTPRTIDGRRYPEHLRPFEELDDQLLPLFAELQPTTFDRLSVAVSDPKVRAVLPRWLSSAEWRGLVEREDASMASPRTYGLGAQGRHILQRVA